MTFGTVRRLVGVATALVMLAACADDPVEQAPEAAEEELAADCEEAVAALLARTQSYLDGVTGTSQQPASGTPAPDTAGEDAAADYSTALADVRRYAASRGCDPRDFQQDLAAGLGGLTAGGPVAGAVLRQLQADAVPGGAPTSVAAGDDVAAAVAAAPSGAVVELGPGAHELEESLVLLRGVTLRGAGRDATTLRATAAGGVVLVLTGESVALEGLALVQGGPGPVVSAGPQARLALRGARVAGAREGADGTGGVGVLMAAGASGQTGPRRVTTLEAVDLHAVDNAVAGVLLAGDHRGDLRDLLVERSGQCGVCFFDTADGTVTGGRFVGNAVGVVAAGRSAPGVRGASVSGGEVGVQASDDGAPRLDEVAVSGASTSAFFFADRSRGAVRGSTCTDVPAGIVVSPEAAPEVGENSGCTLARGQ